MCKTKEKCLCQNIFCGCIDIQVHFFKVSQPTFAINQNIPQKLAIPAQGIADIRNSLSEILDEYGADEGNSCWRNWFVSWDINILSH